MSIPPISIGALKRALRYTLIPYGRSTPASAATLARYIGVRICALALTLLSTAPLMPIEAFARA